MCVVAVKASCGRAKGHRCRGAAHSRPVISALRVGTAEWAKWHGAYAHTQMQLKFIVQHMGTCALWPCVAELKGAGVDGRHLPTVIIALQVGTAEWAQWHDAYAHTQMQLKVIVPHVSTCAL